MAPLSSAARKPSVTLDLSSHTTSKIQLHQQLLFITSPTHISNFAHLASSTLLPPIPNWSCHPWIYFLYTARVTVLKWISVRGFPWHRPFSGCPLEGTTSTFTIALHSTPYEAQGELLSLLSLSYAKLYVVPGPLHMLFRLTGPAFLRVFLRLDVSHPLGLNSQFPSQRRCPWCPM